MLVDFFYQGKQLDSYESSAQMKFKKKAAKVSMLLGFKRKLSPSPSSTPDKPAKKFLKQVSYYLDLKAHPIQAQNFKLAQIKPGKERFDRISGDKEVFMAHTLNYAYLFNAPITLFFRLGTSKTDLVHVRIRAEWISGAGIQGLKFEASFYR